MAAPHTATRMDWCIVCQAPRDIEDISIEQIGYEERTETFVAIALSCGHHTTAPASKARYIA